MAKEFLDLQGLTTYDGLLKNQISTKGDSLDFNEQTRALSLKSGDTVLDVASIPGGGNRLDDVSGATITTSFNTATISWSDPADVTAGGVTLASWAGTLVVRKAGSAPTNRTDGTIVVTNTTRDQYSVSGFTDTGLTYGTTYYYRFFPYTDGYTYTDGSSVNATPTRIVIATVPSQSGTITYDGTEQTATFSDYDVNKMTVTGNTGTNADTYTAQFTPKEGYCWNDNTLTAKSVTWTIDKATLTVPAQSGSLTYNTTEQTASWDSNYDSTKMSVSGNKATNAGTHTATFSLLDDDNYQWTGGSTSDQDVNWSIAKATFTATVSISNYTYAGVLPTPSVSANPGNGTVTYYASASSGGATTNWDSVTNTTYDAGTRYIYAVIAATTNYESYTTAEASFTISKATFIATVSIDGYTYAGTKSTPSVSVNPGNGAVTYYGRATAEGTATAWSNVTSTTYDAGTRYCYAVIAETTNYNSYTTANTSFTIAKASFTATATFPGYTYAGTKSSPSVSANPGNATVTYYGRNVSGGTAIAWGSVTSTTYDAGTHYGYAVIAESTNYNGYTTAETSFAVAQATGAVLLSSNSVTLTTSQLYADITITQTGNGSLSVSSNNTSVATVSSISNNTFRITAQSNGSCTITVTAAASTNYTSASATVSVTCSLVGALNDTSWADISAISAAGTASTYWNIGDTKTITLNGTVGTKSYDNLTVYVYILGFDHNSSVEGTGISFGCFKTAQTGGTDICLDDANYDSYKVPNSQWFSINHQNGTGSVYGHNFGGWKGCDLRYDILGSTNVQPSEYNPGSTPITISRVGYDATNTCATNPVSNTLMAALPSDLRAVMKPITKYTDNYGDSSTASYHITASVDYLPLLAEYEIHGSRSNANQYEQNSQVQYTYYSNGNLKIKCKQSAVSNMADWWSRSPSRHNSYCFVRVTASGDSIHTFTSYSKGLAPCFLV